MLENVLEESLINLVVPTEESNSMITYDPLPIVNGDEKLLVQLFQNLIGNAIKYRSQETPKIHISAKKEKNQHVISVKDNGIGIPPKQKERIFRIFQRLHRNDEYPGTGIGLAIAQNIVHQHKGKISVESELCKGTTFYFTIPIQD
jgi:light-regulated signal transduction histidine kinase (bacteriophytochrome)